MNWRAVVKVTAAVPNHVTEIRLAGAAHLMSVRLCEQIQAFARMWLARRRYCARLSFFRRNVSCFLLTLSVLLRKQSNTTVV